MELFGMSNRILRKYCLKTPQLCTNHSITRLLAAVEDVQNALNEYGGVLRVLDHLGRNSDNIVREVLAFTAVMLFGGNEGVQV